MASFDCLISSAVFVAAVADAIAVAHLLDLVAAAQLLARPPTLKKGHSPSFLVADNAGPQTSRVQDMSPL